MKFSILKKFAAIAIIVVLSATMFAIPTSALNTTPNYNTSTATAGSYKKEAVLNIKSSYSQIYGGNVGAYFHTTNIGMDSAFKQTTSRKVYIDVKENDSIGDDTARSYTGYFGMYNGYYQPTSFANTYTNSGKIELDSQAELYLRFNVEVVSGDTSKNVKAGIMRYQFWSD